MRAVVSASQLVSATPSSAYFSLLYCGSPQAVGKSLLQHLEPASLHAPTLVITRLLLIPVLFHHSSLVSRSFALSQAASLQESYSFQLESILTGLVSKKNLSLSLWQVHL